MHPVQANEVIDDLMSLAGMSPDAEASSLIGLFHPFRTSGVPENTALESYPGGSELRERLNEAISAVSNFQRSDAMKDAYFIVRLPVHMSSEAAEQLGQRFVAAWMVAGRELCPETSLFDAKPKVRVLEGKPPKYPRAESEQSMLYRTMCKEFPARMDQLFKADSLGQRLSECLYFIACDALLRDFFRWPLMMQDATSVIGGELFESYFALWRHGIKLRMFSDEQVDLYLPYREDGRMIDSGKLTGT